MALKPVTLDIVITKICPKTIYYTLAANGQAEEWRIPSVSKFNKSQLVVGERYRVTSMPVIDTVWNFKKRRHAKVERFDWVSAMMIAPKAKLQARSTKQRQASEAMVALPLVDSGALFQW